jgi:hypothetical protein
LGKPQQLLCAQARCSQLSPQQLESKQAEELRALTDLPAERMGPVIWGTAKRT